jgi:predicted ArsR family transcriptional regulator
MAKLVMHRTASDNKYLHKDFHGALSSGIEYLHETYGPEAVREYLHQFAQSYYAPLQEQIAAHGLAALSEHLESIYAIEGGAVSIELTPDVLTLRIDHCPAVAHMREHGYKVARLFSETSRTVNEAIVEGTPFMAEMPDYDEATGQSTQIFRRRTA